MRWLRELRCRMRIAKKIREIGGGRRGFRDRELVAGRNYAALRRELLRRLFAADLAWRESAAWVAVFFGSRCRA